jgi:hypothetical protein
LAEGDADIFDGMVRVDVEIALRFNREIEHSMAGDLVEHVIEKANPRRQLRLASAIQIELDADFGFQRVA